MKTTDTKRQTRAGLGQRNQPPWGDAPNIIPFPGARTSRHQPEQRGPRSVRSMLGQALRRTRDRLRRLARSPNQVSVQPKSGASTAPHQSNLRGYGGGTVHKRMSA
jgi:hypothetical protein